MSVSGFYGRVRP